MSPKLSRFLRIITIILLSLTAAMTLLGGVGTTCVAFKAEEFGPRMAALVPVKPVFQVLVVVSIAAAVFGIYSIVRLAKNRPGAFNQTLIFLLVGAISSAVQYYYSLTLRGSTAPNNMRLYLTVFTLVVFLLMRFLKVFGRGGEAGKDAAGSIKAAGGAAFVLSGLTVLTTPWWAASTHWINNMNTVNVLFWPLVTVGAGMVLCGGWMLLGLMKVRAARRNAVQVVEEPNRVKYQTAL